MKMFCEYVAKVPGHKNSKGETAEWVIKSHDTGKILSSHKSEDEAKEHLKHMKIFGESIVIQKEVKIPDTNIILEKGDRIVLFEEDETTKDKERMDDNKERIDRIKKELDTTEDETKRKDLQGQIDRLELDNARLQVQINDKEKAKDSEKAKKEESFTNKEGDFTMKKLDENMLYYNKYGKTALNDLLTSNKKTIMKVQYLLDDLDLCLHENFKRRDIIKFKMYFLRALKENLMVEKRNDDEETYHAN